MNTIPCVRIERYAFTQEDRAIEFIKRDLPPYLKNLLLRQERFGSVVVETYSDELNVFEAEHWWGQMKKIGNLVDPKLFGIGQRKALEGFDPPLMDYDEEDM